MIWSFDRITDLARTNSIVGCGNPAVERLSAALGISEKINKESSSLRGDVQRITISLPQLSPNICGPYGRNCSELLRVQLEVDLHVVVIALAESVRQRLDLRYPTGDRLD